MLEGRGLTNGHVPTLHEDDVCPISSMIIKRNGADDDLHKRIDASRTEVDHALDLTSNQQKRTATKHMWKTLMLK